MLQAQYASIVYFGILLNLSLDYLRILLTPMFAEVKSTYYNEFLKTNIFNH